MNKQITLNGAEVIAVSDDAAYVRIPAGMAEPIQDCICDYCKTHPDKPPLWDTLCVPFKGNHAHTVHMPDPTSFRDYCAKLKNKKRKKSY